MFFTKVVLFLSFALAASAMATGVHDVHRRHHVKARLAAEEPVAPTPAVTVVPRKRALGRRCKANSSSVAASSASSQPTGAPQNVGGDVPVFTSSSATVETSSPSTPSSSTHKTKATPTPATPPPSSSNGADPAAGSALETQPHSGDATYYATGLGSCGIVNVDTDYIAAVSHILYDEWPGYAGTNPNDNPICGKKVLAEYLGNQVTITITDRCTGCQEFDLDFSPSAFSQLADQSLGRLHGMTWHFI